MRMLVTGGAGFIGSSLTLDLLAEGHEVTVLDDLSTGLMENLAADAAFVEGDIRDAALVNRVVQKHDAVIHLAAMVSVAYAELHPEACWDVNVTGTQNVLRAAHRAGCARVVLASTSAVYGKDMVLPKREAMLASPASAYGHSKWINERDAGFYAERLGLETVCLRFFNVFGPRQRADSPYAAAIAIALRHAAHSTPFTIFGNGEQSRDFIYVEDVAEALRRAATQSGLTGEVLNVGRGERLTIHEVLDLVEQVCGRRLERHYAPARAGDVPHSVADVSGMADRLGFKARLSPHEGVAKTWAWLQRAGLAPAG